MWCIRVYGEYVCKLKYKLFKVFRTKNMKIKRDKCKNVNDNSFHD